ncbi:tpr repeat protein [Ophiostoma piceae UAMH 11346]|uniref:Succinate dehydrogenase assembly factor 2, mitochondrial n=1 Tax=Ophiostoma piceae (strain UAMH 11346) TaxID=1262450 RepID=S3CW30_OPHP1|nr:tpr repeat protein [Ophiostoma piceae UAMH 11346]
MAAVWLVQKLGKSSAGSQRLMPRKYIEKIHQTVTNTLLQQHPMFTTTQPYTTMHVQRILRPARLLSLRPSLFVCQRPAGIAFYSSDGPSSSSPARHSGPIDPQPASELQLGELPGGTFRIEPLRRVGEDITTTRARLLYQSRKRGTLESDLLLSTFAAANLATMTAMQLEQYDRFLDENDWDIYYWLTQVEEDELAQAAKEAKVAETKGEGRGIRERPAHEWAQTVGTFKPTYRPVPERWQGSEILALLRKHVQERSADGVIGRSDGSAQATLGGQKKKGMAFMPPLTELSRE